MVARRVKNCRPFELGVTYTIYSAAGKPLLEFDRPADLPLYGNSIAFLDHGRLLLTPHAKETRSTGMKILSLWETTDGKEVEDVPGPFPQKAIRFNAAFSFAVTRDESLVAVISSLLPGQPVSVYSTRSWTIKRQFVLASASRSAVSATSLAFCADSRVLAIGRTDGAVDLHELTSGESSKRRLTVYDPRETIPIGAVAFSPDGRYLATAAGLPLQAYKSVPALKLWQVTDLTLIASQLPLAAPIRQISWTRAGSYVAIAAGDRTVRIGSPMGRPNPNWTSLEFQEPVLSVGFSPTDDILAVASGPTLELFGVRK